MRVKLNIDKLMILLIFNSLHFLNQMICLVQLINKNSLKLTNDYLNQVIK